jgi:hypothetical protein
MKVFIGMVVAVLIMSSCEKDQTAPVPVNQFMECTIDSTLWRANSISADHNSDYLRVRAKHANGGSIELRVEGPLQKGTYAAGIHSYIIYVVDTYDHEIFHSFNVVQGIIEITSIENRIVEGRFEANLHNDNGSKKLEDGLFRVQLSSN